MWEKLRHYPQEAKGSAKGQIRTQACLCSTPYLSSTQVWYPIKQQNIPFLHKKIFLPFESQSWQMKTDVTKLFYAKVPVTFTQKRTRKISQQYLPLLPVHTYIHASNAYSYTTHTHITHTHSTHTHIPHTLAHTCTYTTYTHTLIQKIRG